MASAPKLPAEEQTFNVFTHSAAPTQDHAGRGPQDTTASAAPACSQVTDAHGTCGSSGWLREIRTTFSHDEGIARLVHIGMRSGPTAVASLEASGGSAPVSGALKHCRVAAKSADEVADIGHAGLRHQFPNTLARRSQFFDDIDLGALSSRTKGVDGFLQPNGNTRYVLRHPGGVGVDRTTSVPTDVFTVIRRPDGSVVTMFPGTSPMG